MPNEDRGDVRLAQLLDVLLPSFDGVPGAGGLGLAASVARDAGGNPRFATSLQLVLDALATLSRPPRESDVREVEERNPEAVADVVNLAYTSYYTDTRVLAMVERHTGYRADPPQPGGYDLGPFDPSLLSNVLRRAAQIPNPLTGPEKSP